MIRAILRCLLFQMIFFLNVLDNTVFEKLEICNFTIKLKDQNIPEENIAIIEKLNKLYMKESNEND